MRWRGRSWDCWEGQTLNPFQYLISLFLFRCLTPSLSLICFSLLSLRQEAAGLRKKVLILDLAAPSPRGTKRGEWLILTVWGFVVIMNHFSSQFHGCARHHTFCSYWLVLLKRDDFIFLFYFIFIFAVMSFLLSSFVFFLLFAFSSFLSFPFSPCLIFSCSPLPSYPLFPFPLLCSRTGRFQSQHGQDQEISTTGVSTGKSCSRLREIWLGDERSW